MPVVRNQSTARGVCRGPGESSQLPWRVTLGVLITRLVLQPILLTGLVVLLLKLGFYTSPDPVFLFTVLLANTTPTAINMQVGRAFEDCPCLW